MEFGDEAGSIWKMTPRAFHQVLMDPKRSSHAYLAAVWSRFCCRWPNWIVELGRLDLDVNDGCIYSSHGHITRGELLPYNVIIGIFWPTRVRCFWPEWKCSKSTKTWFLHILECIGCVRGKNSLRDSRGELLSINANIGTRVCDWYILAHTGAMFFTGMKKFKKHQNMIFAHIGVYWVCSWQKLTSWFAQRTFVN